MHGLDLIEFKSGINQKIWPGNIVGETRKIKLMQIILHNIDSILVSGNRISQGADGPDDKGEIECSGTPD